MKTVVNWEDWKSCSNFNPELKQWVDRDNGWHSDHDIWALQVPDYEGDLENFVHLLERLPVPVKAEIGTLKKGAKGVVKDIPVLELASCRFRFAIESKMALAGEYIVFKVLRNASAAAVQVFTEYAYDFERSHMLKSKYERKRKARSWWEKFCDWVVGD